FEIPARFSWRPKPLKRERGYRARWEVDRPNLTRFSSQFRRRHLHELALRRHLANVLRDLHRAVLRTAHAAEVGALERVLRQRLVVVRSGGFRVERQFKLLIPVELETGFR